MNRKVYSDEKAGLEHIALQAMAFTMAEYDYNTLRAIYERMNLRLTPIESNAKKWYENGWVEGETPKRYYSYHGIRVAPKYWADIVRTIKPEQIQQLSQLPMRQGQKGSPRIGQFVRAFIDFVHGEPYEDKVRSLDWPMILANERELMEIVFQMAHQPENAAFLKYVDPQILTLTYYTQFVGHWTDLEPVEHAEVLRQVFWENEQLHEAHRRMMLDCYRYNVEFLRTGKLQEVLKQLAPNGGYYMILSAINMLHEGNYMGAWQEMSQILKVLKGDTFEEPLSNFAYAIALGLTDAPQARKTAEKLMKSRKVIADQSCYAMLLALHHYVKGDAAEFFQKNPISNCYNLMCWRLATLFLKHYQIFNKDLPMMGIAEEWVATAGYDYLRLLYSDDFPKLKPIAAKLKEQTGITWPLLPVVKRKQRWELIIDQLMKMNAPKDSSPRQTTAEMERVAYMVNLYSYDVQPKLQKSKDGGVTWSKGRNIALKSFKSGGEKCMTPQDHQVASLVKMYEYGWYNNVSYELGGPKVIAALAGCPNVFSAQTDQHIDIVEEPLQLTVQPAGNGYSVKSNVDLDNLENGISIQQVGNKQVTVTRVSTNQKKTLELLSEIKTFPKESQKQLTALLQGLSQEFTVMSPLLKNATELKRVEANSLISVQVAPVEDQMFEISLAVKPFGTCPPYQRPGKGMEIVSTTIDGERVQTERNLKAEQKHLEKLRQLLSVFDDDQTDDDEWFLDMAQCLELLERLRTASDICFVEWPQGVKMRVVRQLITPDKLTLKISSAGQWFELEGDVKIGDKEKMKVAQLLELLRTASGNFIRLSDDEYVALSEQLRKQLQAIDKMLIGRGKDLKLATMNGLQLSALEEMGAKVKADEPFRQLMKRIEEAGQQQFPLPANIHAELRPYQVVGYQWMSRLAYWGAGACLADDMGLGKTLQAITLMQSRAAQGPQLVIMPTSLLHNWQSELSRFAPALTVKLLNPQGANRQQIVTDAEPADIVLATYGLLVTEGELLSQRTWTTIVLDEAHTIKNRDTQTSKAAMELKADFRLMLTGTPLQNHLNEIWNLFQFANPGLLGSYQQFTDRFILPIERDHDQERQRLLRRLLSPFLLRRTKDDVLNELPEKTEITLRVELSAEEQALYDNLRQQAIANLEEGSKSVLQTLAEITRLRQAACHPRLIDAKLPLKSSKTQAFLELVDELRQSGHRALVFSQFTSHLALIREALDRQFAPDGNLHSPDYLYLDGSTSPAERNRLVRQFQTGSEPLFLISLKAGGLGLNLTAADYVIHLDPWWNPAVEDQASDRAHRIGQERPVTVYRLISAGTIEEKIIRLHQNKRSLADALLEDADMFSQISADDVIRLLREGVDAIN